MENSYERRSPEQIEFETLLDRAFEKAKDTLGSGDTDMQDPEFVDLYKDQQIQIDLQKVKDYEEIFASKPRTPEQIYHEKIGKILEALFHEQASINHWLGENTKVSRTSRFDDVVNGVDEVVEYEEKGKASYLALAIDATSSSHPGWKFSKIRDQLRKRELGKIKYFKAKNFVGTLKDLAKVVIGASPENLQEVIKLWVSDENEKLKNHPIQTLFLEQAVTQLENFKSFSEREKDLKNVKVFERDLEILKPILAQKRKAAPLTEKLQKDSVFAGIKAELVGLNYVRHTA